MSLFLLTVARFLLDVLYAVLKLLPVSKKVTFLSRQANTPGVDFVLLEEWMREAYPEYKTVMLCKTLDKGAAAKIKYMFHMLRQMYHCATSRAAVLDSYCIIISFLTQRRSLKVFQIWHSLGLFKKFGYSILDKKEGSKSGVARVMRMHEGYSHVICSSPAFTAAFAEAFGCAEEKILPLGLPRMDYIQSSEAAARNRDRIFSVYPALDNGRKNLLYVPTFRKFGKEPLQKVIDKVDLAQYNLIIKLHSGKELVFVDTRKNKKTGRNGTGMDFLHVADAVITDYSAILYEAALARKPLYLYCCDYDSYMDSRGLYLDYFKDIPGVVSRDINVILSAVDKGVTDEAKLEAFLDYNVPYRHLNMTAALCDVIIGTVENGSVDLPAVIRSEKYVR